VSGSRPLRPLARAARRLAGGLAALCAAGCATPDPAARAAVAERDALRREVAGLRALQATLGGSTDMTGGLGPDDAFVVVRDSLVRALLDATLPTTVRLRDRAEVRLERASAAFEANVTRIALVGTVRQLGWPHAAATLRLGGALADFVVDSTSTLRARLAIDEVLVSDPMGVPAPLRAPARALLQQVADRGLPQVVAALPGVAIPVRLDQTIALPGFGPEGPITVAPVEARVAIAVRRVATWDGYTWIVLRTTRSPFVAVRPAAARPPPAAPVARRTAR
jgi:hypothetical protein